MTRFRDAYASTSRKNICSEPKTEPFQYLNNKIVRSHSSVFIFALTSRKHVSTEQDDFSNQTVKSLGPTPPFLFSKICGIYHTYFTHIQQKRHSQTPAVALFRNTYAPTSRKYVCTEPKTRPF